MRRRGLAATAVLIFHLDPPRYFIGRTGVDLFFVLSGYLITSIILGHGRSQGFLIRFYARRTLRIWPIYYVTILGFAVLNPWFSRPQPLNELPYLLTFTKLLPLWWHGSYPALILPLNHTWTLSLEEQFYLLWPALILRLGPRSLMVLCVALAGLSVTARAGQTLLIWNPFSDQILLGRSDGFALGGLLAALLFEARRQPRWRAPLRIALAVSAASAVAYLVSAYHFPFVLSGLGFPPPNLTGSTNFAFVLGFFGTIGLVALSAGHALLAPLRLRPLVGLGQVSYGLYLYHLPIYWLLDGCAFRYDHTLLHNTLKLALCVAAAAVSWMLFEKPILGLKDRFRYARGSVDGQ